MKDIKNSADTRKSVHYILLNNYRILSTLRKKGMEFSLMYLRDLGFSFRYMTAMEEKADGVVNYCYNFGYSIDQDTIRLL